MEQANSDRVAVRRGCRGPAGRRHRSRLGCPVGAQKALCVWCLSKKFRLGLRSPSPLGCSAPQPASSLRIWLRAMPVFTPDFRRGCGDSPVSIPASNSAIVMPKHRAISTMAWKERFFSPCPAPQQKSDEHGHRRKTVPASSPLLCRVHVCDFPKRCVVPPVRPGRDQFHVEACPLRKSQSFHR